MTTGHDPLTQEERVLAARLARLGVSEGPAPALDARILAAAHHAVLRTPAPRRRWPVAFGAAASVVLAVGVAWQMRPAQWTTQAYAEPTAVRTARMSGPSAAEDLPVAQDSAAAAIPQAKAASASASEASPDAIAAPAAEDAQMRAQPEQAAMEPPPPSPEAFPEERKALAPPAPPAPAPPPPPPPRPASAAGSDIVFDAPAAAAPAQAPVSNAEAARGAAVQQRREASEQAAEADAPELDQVTVTGSRVAREREGFTDDQLDDEPPATADSPQVQRAWLQRIREMVADGDVDSARASLVEFKRRYPRYALPEDLRALAP